MGLSKASVTRFAYALGFTGFAELRERLQKELLQRNNRGFKDILDQSYRESPGAVPHLYDFLREDMELLERTMAKLSVEAFEQAVEAVLKAESITVAGSRRARGLAVILAMTLNNFLGNTRLAPLYSGELADEIQRLRPDGLLIAFAFARYVRESVLMVQLAARKGVLTDYQGGMIVSTKAVEEFGDNFRMNPIGTGPFQLAEYVPRQYVRLVRNEQYFRGVPQIEEVVYRFMPDLRSRELAFRAGELDVMEGLREQWWVEDIQQMPGIVVDVVGPGEMRTLHYNMSRPPFNDIRVRQAISYLINRDEIVEIIGPSVTVPAYSPVPPGYMAHTDDVERYDYNPRRPSSSWRRRVIPTA